MLACVSRYPTSRQLGVKEVAALDSLLPAGQKKAPKVYRIAAHPLQPHLLAVGANTGAHYTGDVTQRGSALHISLYPSP